MFNPNYNHYGNGNTPERQSFIVQNVTPSQLFISDIRLTLGPLQVIDFTWHDPAKIHGSSDLKRAIKIGLLKLISQDDADEFETERIENEKRALLKSQRDQKFDEVDSENGSKHFADVVDLEKGDTARGQAQVTTAGYANDPLSYALALDMEQANYEARGARLTAAEFARKVEANPKLVSQILERRTASVSGDTRRGRAYVAAPPGEGGDAGVYNIGMTNLNRNSYIAGASESGYAVQGPHNPGLDANPSLYDQAYGYENPKSAYETQGYGEAIDLNAEVDLTPATKTAKVSVKSPKAAKSLKKATVK